MEKAEGKYLEDLDVFDALLGTTLLVDGAPLFNNTLDVGLLEPCESQIMAGMEAKDVATTLHRLSRKQWMRGRRGRGARRR